jgi:hypothetical protein
MSRKKWGFFEKNTDFGHEGPKTLRHCNHGLRGFHGFWFGGVRQGRSLHFQRKDFYKQACSILFFSTAFALQFTPNHNKSMIISTRTPSAGAQDKSPRIFSHHEGMKGTKEKRS